MTDNPDNTHTAAAHPTFRSVVDKSTNDALRAVFGNKGNRIIWLQALGFIGIGLLGGIWLETGSWFGASAETHRAILTFAAATFVGSLAVFAAVFSFVSSMIQQRYSSARGRALAAIGLHPDATSLRQVLWEAEYALDLLRVEARFEPDETEPQLHWEACKRAARDDYLARRFYRNAVVATTSFGAIAFVFLVVERAYNPLELLLAGYCLWAVGDLLSKVITSKKVEDTEGLIEVPK